MTAYAVQSAPHNGLQLSGTLPTTGAVDTCPTGSNIAMVVTGPSSASATVAIPLPNVDGQAVTARSVTIASGQNWLIPMPASVYGSGPVTLTWSGTLTGASVNVVTVAGS